MYPATRGHTETLAHVSTPDGRDHVEVPVLHAGDIGCVAKSRNTHTNDTLSTRERPVRLPEIRFSGAARALCRARRRGGDEETVQQGYIGCTKKTPRWGFAESEPVPHGAARRVIMEGSGTSEHAAV